MTLARLDDDMRAVIAAQRLCFAATVTPEEHLRAHGPARLRSGRGL